MDLRAGDTVYGQTKDFKYEVTRMLGHGNFGIVFEVQDKNGTKYALKTIITAALNEDNLLLLLNEGQLATEIQHENVVRVIYFHDGKQYPEFPPYMIMEYAENGTLDKLLEENRNLQKQFDIDQLNVFFTQLALGMNCINKKLVHRDVKPDNILISNGLLKIADFGLSKIVGAATRTNSFKGINHIMYCAPEAWRVERNTPAMDMYSMGIVFYELATLKHPYQINTNIDVIEAWKTAHMTQMPKNPKELNPSLSLGLSQLILKMLSKRPEDRYSSWNEVLDRLKTQEDSNNSKHKVSSLIETATQAHQKAERVRLEAEEKVRLEQEREDLIKYSFGEIVNSVQEIVNEFNQSNDIAKLKLDKSSPFQFSVSKDTSFNQHNPKVTIVIQPLDEGNYIDNQSIKAWGHAKTPSGAGFNLILVSSSPEDLYGHWLTIHATHNPIARVRDNRPEPFPFEFKELPRQIQLLKAVGFYQVKVGKYNVEFFDDLIKELFS